MRASFALSRCNHMDGEKLGHVRRSCLVPRSQLHRKSARWYGRFLDRPKCPVVRCNCNDVEVVELEWSCAPTHGGGIQRLASRARHEGRVKVARVRGPHKLRSRSPNQKKIVRKKARCATARGVGDGDGGSAAVAVDGSGREGGECTGKKKKEKRREAEASFPSCII